VIELERKTRMLAISTVLVLALFSGVAVMVYANMGANGTGTMMYVDGLTYATGAANASCNCGDMPVFFGRGPHRWGHGGPITISQEFKDNVINITESDTDVQQLLTEGYNITEVRPIINTTVEADGTVTTKATNAVVTLIKDTTGRATVWVSIEQAKVTRIEILSITVIEKP